MGRPVKVNPKRTVKEIIKRGQGPKDHTWSLTDLEWL